MKVRGLEALIGRKYAYNIKGTVGECLKVLSVQVYIEHDDFVSHLLT